MLCRRRIDCGFKGTRILRVELRDRCRVCALWDFMFFFSSRRRHTRLVSDWSSDVCSSDLAVGRVLDCVREEIPDRLAQVVGNLLSNAIKYSPDGGVVDVTAEAIGDEAWIWVRDEGLGIPGGHQEQIFTKFFRGDVGRELGISGTGLGLVLARQIVEAHRGQIGFESESGRGSTFWLQLPASRSYDDGAPEPSLAARDNAEPRHGM